MPNAVYTIGHSTNSIERFVDLLELHGITAVGDVRSMPYSRFNPQFNREPLAMNLKKTGIEYVFLGKELGARSHDSTCYRDNKVRYDFLAETDLFKEGIARVTKGAQLHRIALMCAEKDPLDCHRAILVARSLVERGLSVNHILADGGIESHEAALDRLLETLGMEAADFFRAREDTIREAYDKRGKTIAYSEANSEEGDEKSAPRQGSG